MAEKRESERGSWRWGCEELSGRGWGWQPARFHVLTARMLPLAPRCLPARRILSIAALQRGLYTVVATSLIGSILSNLLLVLGACLTRWPKAAAVATLLLHVLFACSATNAVN